MLRLGIFLCLLISIEGQNPCDPNPCGPNTRCLTRPGSAFAISCECKEGKIRKIEFSVKNFCGKFVKIETFASFCTVFEKSEKCHSRIFQFWHFPPIFVLLTLTCLETLFDRKLQMFKTSPKLIIFCIFNELLATQNVNVARFARNVECDFFSEFQTLWLQIKCEELELIR